MDSKAAEKYAASLRATHDKGLRAVIISAALAREAQEAVKILEGTGLTLLEVARAAAERFKSNAAANEPFRTRYRTVLLDGEGRWSGSMLSQMEKMDRWLPEWLMVMPCSEITRPVMERAINDGGTKSRSTIDLRCRYMSAVVHFRERHRKGKEIAMMTAAEAQAMLDACESQEERWAVALLLFAGIRPSSEDGEIRRLDWEDVGKSEIYVSRSVSKVGDRHIPIQPRLARLIEGHPAEGPVIPANWKKTWARIRKASGVSDKQDVTRHTFASHHLAAFGEEKTKRAMGHTAGSSTLFRHYRRSVTEQDGEAYFA